MKDKLFTIVIIFLLGACSFPKQAKNPAVTERPVSTTKFLTSKDYYSEASISHTQEPIKKKEVRSLAIEDTALVVESSEFPLNKHYHKPTKIIESEEELKLAPTSLYDEEGLASWYGPGFHGRKTANGEVYNQFAMTAAHKKLPLGSKVEVTNLNNGKTVKLRINDRGPYIKGRIIDVSKAAAQKLGLMESGVGKVRVKRID